jgi:hypothetical protein
MAQGQVRASIIEGILELPSLETSAATTVLDDTYGLICVDATLGNKNVNLPIGSTLKAGRAYWIRKTDTGANTVTINISGPDSIEGAFTLVLNLTSRSVILVWSGSSWRPFGQGSTGGGGAADSIAVSGLDTSFNTMSIGQAGYIEVAGTGRVKQAIATVAASRVFGFYSGVVGQMVASGSITALFDAGLTVNNGDSVFLSKITAGKVTNNTIAFSSPDVIAEVGIVIDSSSYVGFGTAVILIQIKPSVLL